MFDFVFFGFRLLVTSMQSICLEGSGGEDAVHPKLQETTFIQHTFGGQLRSKVESENIFIAFVFRVKNKK